MYRKLFILFSISLMIGLLTFKVFFSPQQTLVVENENHNPLLKVKLLTDWYAQPEHGGYYQALELGYYKECGLDVEIVQGGLRCGNYLRVSSNEVQFSIGRSDDVMIRISQGLPLIIVGAEMQHDPSCLIFHKSHPLSSLQDLQGRILKAGIGMIWHQYAQKELNLDFNLIPMGNGLGEFLSYPNVIQQCYITNEPYILEQANVDFGSLLIYQQKGALDPYRVIFTHKEFLKNHKDIVKKFVNASLLGWQSFLADPAPAFKRIQQDNQTMSDHSYMLYAYEKLKTYQLITGNPLTQEKLGQLLSQRLLNQKNQLLHYGFIEADINLHSIVDLDI